MKRSILLCISLVCAILVAHPAPGSGASQKILVFVRTQGFYHASIRIGMTTIMNLCRENNIGVDTSRDASVFTKANLKQYNVVVFLNTTGDILNEEQQSAFEAYIRAGGGFVGVHAATDTEYKWPWYNKLVGAYFLSHPEQQQAVIRIVNKNNPATEFLPAEWKRTDEWYNFKDIQPDIQVLAYLDESTYKGGANGEKHPFVWCHEFDGGRAFYTGVGHRDDNYDEPLVQKHLLGAIKWAGKIK
jgi:type 1 glutamine amidotransferase